MGGELCYYARETEENISHQCDSNVGLHNDAFDRKRSSIRFCPWFGQDGSSRRVVERRGEERGRGEAGKARGAANSIGSKLNGPLIAPIYPISQACSHKYLASTLAP